MIPRLAAREVPTCVAFRKALFNVSNGMVGGMRLTFIILLGASLFTWDATTNHGRYTRPITDFVWYHIAQ